MQLLYQVSHTIEAIKNPAEAGFHSVTDITVTVRLRHQVQVLSLVQVLAVSLGS